MARIRTIKPEFWTDSKVVGLSPLARLLFIGAWNFADDYGALPADSLQLKLRVLPAEPCDHESLVHELLKAGVLVEASNGDETFWIVRSWEKHQKVDKRSNSQYGDPDSWCPAEPSESPAESRRTFATEGKGREGKGSTNTVGTADAVHDDGFENFWNTYPRHHDTKATGGGGNKRTARKRWNALSAVERQEVLEAVVPYAKLCGPNGQKPKHAERFLINEAWQPYLPAARAGPDRSDVCKLCERPKSAPDHDALCEVFR
jgi:hypothetical protein